MMPKVNDNNNVFSFWFLWVNFNLKTHSIYYYKMKPSSLLFLRDDIVKIGSSSSCELICKIGSITKLLTNVCDSNN